MIAPGTEPLCFDQPSGANNDERMGPVGNSRCRLYKGLPVEPQQDDILIGFLIEWVQFSGFSWARNGRRPVQCLFFFFLRGNTTELVSAGFGVSKSQKNDSGEAAEEGRLAWIVVDRLRGFSYLFSSVNPSIRPASSQFPACAGGRWPGKKRDFLESDHLNSSREGRRT